jgi:hypothetical protein
MFNIFLQRLFHYFSSNKYLASQARYSRSLGKQTVTVTIALSKTLYEISRKVYDEGALIGRRIRRSQRPILVLKNSEYTTNEIGRI